MIQLILLLVCGTTYLAGLGWLLIGPVYHGSLIVRKKTPFSPQETALSILAGLILNYAITLRNDSKENVTLGITLPQIKMLPIDFP